MCSVSAAAGFGVPEGLRLLLLKAISPLFSHKYGLVPSRHSSSSTAPQAQQCPPPSAPTSSSPLPFPPSPPSLSPTPSPPLWTPTAATLISSAHEAILVDPLFTTTQATALADWIDALFPDKRLTYIYITHGHGDHFFGLSTLRQRFPNATAVATEGVLKHMEQQISPAGQAVWETLFPGGQIVFPASPPAKALPAHDLTLELEGHKLHAVPAGHSDTDDSSFLWVPDLKLAVAGDIVYNNAYSFLAETLTAPLREQWIDAIQKVRSFRPETVIVGHKTPSAVDGAWNLDATERYIEMWGRLVGEAKDAEDMFNRVRREDPDRTGEFVLWWSCLQQFPREGNATAKA